VLLTVLLTPAPSAHRPPLTTPRRSVHVSSDAARLAQAAATHFIAAASDAISARGRFTCALAGGSTPKGLYTLLSQPPYVDRVDWSKVELFWGDERCVAPEHAESNFRMVQESLLNTLKEPPKLHRMLGEIEPALAAAAYAETLRAAFPKEAIPRFDLVLLGIGEDGHTASLFPGTAALEAAEAWVTSTPPTDTRGARLSLTLPVLNAARQVNFLVAGPSKQQRLLEILTDLVSGPRLPAARVNPNNGSVLWFVDKAAALLLEPSAYSLDSQ
jgi:6-phosphogluconolactonase